MIYGDIPVKWNESPSGENELPGINTCVYMPDFSAIEQSGNLYAYVGGNPISRFDPTGEAWWHWALGAAIVVACAAATVATCGGFAAAVTAVGLVARGTSAATAASTVAAAAFIGSATVYGASVVVAATNSKSVQEFNDKGNWGTVGSVALGAVYGGCQGYKIYKASNPESEQNITGENQNSRSSVNKFNLNGSKGEGYIDRRGWSTEKINTAIDNGQMGTSVNKATGQACSVYCYPGTKDYVVIEDATGSLVQVSQFGDAEWLPDNTIIWNK